MKEHVTCDSRQYRFGYRLQAASDLPGDFSIPPVADEWLAAIFIPGDTEALWKLPEYPPRVYILTRETLMVYSHPTANSAPYVVPLRELIEIDTEKALLYGVIEFHACGSSERLRYNTLHQKHLNAFLRVLRAVWLPRHGMPLPAVALSRTTRGMTFRCWYALRAELDTDETLLGVCCRPPILTEKKGWFHKASPALPEVLLAVTGHRLIAISTGTGETEDLYGITVRSAATCNLNAVAIGSLANGFQFSLKLKNGREWRLLFEDDQGARVACFRDLLERLALTEQELAADSSPAQEFI